MTVKENSTTLSGKFQGVEWSMHGKAQVGLTLIGRDISGPNREKFVEFAIVPLDDHLILRPLTSPATTEGGIHKVRAEQMMQAQVYCRGPAVKKFRVGDIVGYNPMSGLGGAQLIMGEEVLVVREKDITYRIESRPLSAEREAEMKLKSAVTNAAEGDSNEVEVEAN